MDRFFVTVDVAAAPADEPAYADRCGSQMTPDQAGNMVVVNRMLEAWATGKLSPFLASLTGKMDYATVLGTRLSAVSRGKNEKDESRTRKDGRGTASISRSPTICNSSGASCSSSSSNTREVRRTRDSPATTKVNSSSCEASPRESNRSTAEPFSPRSLGTACSSIDSLSRSSPREQSSSSKSPCSRKGYEELTTIQASSSSVSLVLTGLPRSGASPSSSSKPEAHSASALLFTPPTRAGRRTLTVVSATPDSVVNVAPASFSHKTSVEKETSSAAAAADREEQSTHGDSSTSFVSRSDADHSNWSGTENDGFSEDGEMTLTQIEGRVRRLDAKKARAEKQTAATKEKQMLEMSQVGKEVNNHKSSASVDSAGSRRQNYKESAELAPPRPMVPVDIPAADMQALSQFFAPDFDCDCRGPPDLKQVFCRYTGLKESLMWLHFLDTFQVRILDTNLFPGPPDSKKVYLDWRYEIAIPAPRPRTGGLEERQPGDEISGGNGNAGGRAASAVAIPKGTEPSACGDAVVVRGFNDLICYTIERKRIRSMRIFFGAPDKWIKAVQLMYGS